MIKVSLTSFAQIIKGRTVMENEMSVIIVHKNNFEITFKASPRSSVFSTVSFSNEYIVAILTKL